VDLRAVFTLTAFFSSQSSMAADLLAFQHTVAFLYGFEAFPLLIM
jgi:hypothetical protein